jgi:hypothetical protein
MVAAVGNELTANKGHIDKTVLIRGVQLLNFHLNTGHYKLSPFAEIDV